jgi:hypothetical protein
MTVRLILKLFCSCKVTLFRSVTENTATGQNETMINGTEYTGYEKVVTADVTSF